MPVFRNIFACSSQDTESPIQAEMNDLRERINRLEIHYDNVKDDLNEIKMDLKVIRLLLQQLQQT